MPQPLSNAAPNWSADPTVNWNIALVVHLDRAAPPDMQERLDLLNDELASPRSRIRTGTDVAELTSALTRSHQATVQLGVAPVTPTAADPATWALVLTAHHSKLDGLGLVAALARVLDVTAHAEARGLDGRDAASQSLLRRLVELVLRRSDVVPAVDGVAGSREERFTTHRVEGTIHTSTLVVGALQGVASFTRRHGHRVRRPSVAVGASWVGGDPLRLGVHSALLRMADMRSTDEDGVRRTLARTAPETFDAAFVPGLTGAAVRLGMRILRPLLGSTVLVSHLGRIHVDGVTGMTLHPASSGGSGVAIGACTLVRPDASTLTTVSLRSRGSRHSQAAVQELTADLLRALHHA